MLKPITLSKALLAVDELGLGPDEVKGFRIKAGLPTVEVIELDENLTWEFVPSGEGMYGTQTRRITENVRRAVAKVWGGDLEKLESVWCILDTPGGMYYGVSTYPNKKWSRNGATQVLDVEHGAIVNDLE